MIARMLLAVTLGGLAVPHAAVHHHSAHHLPTHVAPTHAAWYDATRPTALTPATPAIGVAKTDLLVQGLTISTSALPLALPSIPPIQEISAFAALTFRLPAGASPASLTLKLTGLTTAKIDAKLPSGATPLACLATGKVKSGGEQPMSAAPKYDCSKRSAVGQLAATGDAISFPGIGRLQTGRTLSIVILPGSLGLERLVFTAPTKSSLSLLSFPSTSSSPPASIPPVPTPTPTPDSVAATTGSSGSLPSGPAVSVPPADAVSQPPVAAGTPQVATSSAPAQALATEAAPVDDTRARTAAVGGLVLILVVTAWLILTERGGRAAAGEPAGIGKFRAPRNGPPPTI